MQSVIDDRAIIFSATANEFPSICSRMNSRNVNSANARAYRIRFQFDFTLFVFRKKRNIS